MTSYDNAYALKQIELGHYELLSRPPATSAHLPGPAKKGKTLPRVITLGGDHTITLPLLRSVTAAYGPISVVHFDSHLDTWRPKVFGGAPTEQAAINHGTYFYHAHEQGLLANDSNIHAGIRTTLSGLSDYDNDGYCGFEIVEAREIDKIGVDGIITKIRERVGTERPVYLSIDIDTLDPACWFPPSPNNPPFPLPPSLHLLLRPSFLPTPLTKPFSPTHSRPRHRHPRDRRLDHEGTADDHSRAPRHQLRRRRHCRGGARLRHECGVDDHGRRGRAVRGDGPDGEEGSDERDGGWEDQGRRGRREAVIYLDLLSISEERGVVGVGREGTRMRLHLNWKMTRNEIDTCLWKKTPDAA